MADKRISVGCHTVTDEDSRILINILESDIKYQSFVRFLTRLKHSNEQQLDKVMQAYLMNDKPETRALALALKGKVELIADLMRLCEEVAK